MNREIEFRGQCVLNGEWLYGDLEYSRNDKDVVRIHTYNDDGSYKQQCLVVPDTVGQFTGLVDKNGVKIFEGDILELVVTYQGKPVGEPRIRKVVWKGSGLYIVNKHNDCVCERSATCQEEEYRVIGNIHNNPELLSTKQA